MPVLLKQDISRFVVDIIQPLVYKSHSEGVGKDHQPTAGNGMKRWTTILV